MRNDWVSSKPSWNKDRKSISLIFIAKPSKKFKCLQFINILSTKVWVKYYLNMLTYQWYCDLKLREDKSSLRYFADSLAKNCSWIKNSSEKDILGNDSSLRRPFNYSEEDISGNDSSEEDNQLFWGGCFWGG